MSRRLLSAAIAPLPFAIREQLESYADFVDATADDLLPEGGARTTSSLRDDFVFTATLRRLWHLVSGEYWLLDHALALSDRLRVGGLSAGGTLLIRGEGVHSTIRQLRDNLDAELRRNGLSDLVRARSLEELVTLLVNERDDGPR
jgi:hypothetical protein